MKYLHLLQQNEKQVLESLQKQFNITLSGEYPADFQEIKSALETRWEDLKEGEVTIGALSTFETQVKYMKELKSVINKAYTDNQKEIADCRALIHEHFTNWV